MMRAAKIDLASRLKDTARVDPVRVPALTPVLEASAVHLGSALAQLIGLDVRVSVESATPCGDDTALRSAGAQVRATFHVDGSGAIGALGLVSLDQIVDAMFGGDGQEAVDTHTRDLTSLERTVAARVLAAAMSALQNAFGTIAPFVFEQQAEAVAGADDPPAFGSWLGIRYEVAFSGLSTALFVLFPQSALQPLRSSPSRESNEPAVAEDPAWTAAMKDEVARTAVSVQAVLVEPGITLATIAGLRVGSVLPLRATPRAAVALTCEGRTLVHGQFGQRDGIYTVRIGEALQMDSGA